MTTAKKIWPHTEVAAHLDEILQLAESEPQRIIRPDGTTFILQTQPAPAPARRTGMSIYEDFPADVELVTERLKDSPRDLEL